MFQDRQQSGPRAVSANDVGLHLIAVAHLCDIPHINWSAIYYLDGDVIKGGDELRTAVEMNQVLAGTNLRGAGRKNEVLQP